MKNEEILKQAAERNVRRKARVKARADLYPHFAEAIEPIEKLRGLCEILASQHNVSSNELWQWAVKQLSE